MAAGKRDVTRIISNILGALNTTNADERMRFLEDALQIARDVDGRTGRRDPSKRRRPAKKATKA